MPSDYLMFQVIRYNRLLVVIQHTLKDLLKALKGLVVMSLELEMVLESLYNNTVPKTWAAKVQYLYCMQLYISHEDIRMISICVGLCEWEIFMSYIFCKSFLPRVVNTYILFDIHVLAGNEIHEHTIK